MPVVKSPFLWSIGTAHGVIRHGFCRYPESPKRDSWWWVLSRIAYYQGQHIVSESKVHCNILIENTTEESKVFWSVSFPSHQARFGGWSYHDQNEGEGTDLCIIELYYGHGNFTSYILGFLNCWIHAQQTSPGHGCLFWTHCLNLPVARPFYMDSSSLAAHYPVLFLSYIHPIFWARINVSICTYLCKDTLGQRCAMPLGYPSTDIPHVGMASRWVA